jgi:hypothetical protein
LGALAISLRLSGSAAGSADVAGEAGAGHERGA